MVKIAICDDEINVCSKIKEYLEKYSKKNSIEMCLDICYTAEKLLLEIEKGSVYDLIILDIEMQGLSGVEVGELIRKRMNNEKSKIVFISWKDSYALELFKIGTLDYIIKPINELSINALFDRFLKLYEVENKYFAYRIKGECNMIHTNEIMYIISSGRKIRIYNSSELIEFIEKLDTVNERLDKNMFWRIHKSIILNIMYVDRFDYNKVLLKNGVELNISQPYRVEIRKKQKKLLRVE